MLCIWKILNGFNLCHSFLFTGAICKSKLGISYLLQNHYCVLSPNPWHTQEIYLTFPENIETLLKTITLKSEATQNHLVVPSPLFIVLTKCQSCCEIKIGRAALPLFPPTSLAAEALMEIISRVLGFVRRTQNETTMSWLTLSGTGVAQRCGFKEVF